ncbi:hypothetical protein GCM10010196_15230 [Agromyces mediolanus]|uniref:Uncharacterized protein n=1 Tax=Agromyces mediolanus TaxID=41986 RepID=A0A918CH19_AGRME|nr:hypothetical protein GCM10010196_15230 [Agromyces mediolanus]GLJ71221.1 hypothetical protein GCM10017583_04760 [Agromyces mediolanus]
MVTAAAARSAWRFALTLLVERDRAAGDAGASAFAALFAARAEPAALVRSAVARLEALREAPERFDAGAGSLAVSVSSPRCCRAASAFAASALRAARVAAARFAASERFALFAAASAEPAAVDFATVFFAAAGRFGAVAPFARAGAADVDSPWSACADTPVPVPSGASSVESERETEVTQQTYQLPAPDPCPVVVRTPAEN